MAKRVIEENVVLTTFEINEAARQENIRKHRTYVNNIKKSYQELTTSMSAMAASFANITSQLEKSVAKLATTNELLASRLQHSLEKIAKSSNNSMNRLSKNVKPANSGFTSLLKTIGNIEQALYRLSAGLFITTFGFNKLLGEQRDLYYLSQKLSMPVSEISKYAYVVSQIGGDADKAKESLNRFSQTLQDMARGQNAEALQVFGRLGISQFNANGTIKSVPQAMTEVKQKLRTVESTQTKINYLRKLGFDENEFNYFLQYTELLEARFENIYERITGLDSKDFLADASRRVATFSNELRTLNTTLNITLQQFIQKLLPHLHRFIATTQVKLMDNNKNLVKVLYTMGAALTEIGRVIVSVVDMLVMFTGGLISAWNSLDEGTKSLAKLGVAFVGFFKLFSSSLLSSPMMRFISLLTMGLLLIQDYVYWKRQMNNENYAAYYDWSEIDKYIQKFTSLFDGFENPFDNWNNSLLELIKNMDLLIIAATAFSSALGGKKVPIELGNMIRNNPKLFRLVGILAAGGYLVYDEFTNKDKDEGSLLQKGAGAVENFLTKIFKNKNLYKNTYEGQLARQNLYKASPYKYFHEAYINEDFRNLEGLTRKEAMAGQNKYKIAQDPAKILYENSGKGYEDRGKDIAEKLNMPLYQVMDDKHLIAPVTFKKYIRDDIAPIPQQNLGAESGVVNNNNNNNIHISKGNTEVNINGNVDGETLSEIKRVIHKEDRFFEYATSMENIMGLANQLYK